MDERDLDFLPLRDMVEVGGGIDLEQELCDEETPPLIDLMEVEHERGQDHEHQAPTLGDMTPESDQLQGNVDGVSRQVTVLSHLLAGQHGADGEAEESVGHVEPIAYVVDFETGRIIRWEFACVKSDGEIMIMTGGTMMKWTREIIAQRRRAVMEEVQDYEHCILKNIPAL